MSVEKVGPSSSEEEMGDIHVQLEMAANQNEKGDEKSKFKVEKINQTAIYITTESLKSEV